jgi:hypothetical protein
VRKTEGFVAVRKLLGSLRFCRSKLPKAICLL